VDLAIIGTLVGAFAVLVTTHVVLIVSLLLRKPHWRGLVALVFPPLAAYWGIEERMRIRAGLWLVSLVVYVVAHVAATF
jgi:hypothetical protein